MDLFLRLFSRGGPIMWPLLCCSVVSVTIVIERLIFCWRAAAGDDGKLLSSIFRLTEAGRYEEALRAGSVGGSASLRVLRSGLENRSHGLSEAMQIAAADEVQRMKHGLGVLDTIVTMAPLLGILGTVIGIIESFDLLGAAGIEDPKAVTGGIAQALITTAAGLSVALVTLVPFNYLVSRVQREARRLEQIATQFEVAFRAGGSKPSPGR